MRLPARAHQPDVARGRPERAGRRLVVEVVAPHRHHDRRLRSRSPATGALRRPAPRSPGRLRGSARGSRTQAGRRSRSPTRPAPRARPARAFPTCPAPRMISDGGGAKGSRIETRAIRLPRSAGVSSSSTRRPRPTAAEVTTGSARAPDALGLGHEDAGSGPFAVERGHDRDRRAAVGGRERRPEPSRRAPIQPLREHDHGSAAREAPVVDPRRQRVVAKRGVTRSRPGQRRLADRLGLHGAASERPGRAAGHGTRAAALPPSGAWSLEWPRASRAPGTRPAR